MKYLTVRHETRYAMPRRSRSAPHRLMLRPRDSHDLRLVDAELTLSPPGADALDARRVRQLGRAGRVQPGGATELLIDSTLHLEHYGLTAPAVFPIAPEAQIYPFVYSANDRSDLGRLLDRHYPDPHGLVDAWAKRFVTEQPMSTYDLLSNLNAAIKNRLRLQHALRGRHASRRSKRWQRQSGTCRDFALLFIEAVRSLGFGARFVTGYLYDPALDGAKAPCRAPARPMPGPMSICRAPAGWNSTRPMA